MLGGSGGIVRVSRHPVETMQHVPAIGERLIDVNAAPECLDGLRCITERDVAVAALLMQSAISWMMLLKPTKEFERVRHSIHMAQVNRRQVQQVTVVGVSSQEWLDTRERRNVMMRSRQLLQPKCLLLQ